MLYTILSFIDCFNSFLKVNKKISKRAVRQNIVTHFVTEINKSLMLLTLYLSQIFKNISVAFFLLGKYSCMHMFLIKIFN